MDVGEGKRIKASRYIDTTNGGAGAADDRCIKKTNKSSKATQDDRSASAELTTSFQPQDLLHLFLGLKFQGSPPKAFEFLTIQDLWNVRTVSKSIYKSLDVVKYTHCRDGRDYLVPFPGFPGLLSTKQDRELGSGLFSHQLASLASMHQMENSSTDFGALRGGILGDAPGLGKTITMLALISSTAGQRPINPPEFWDSSNLNEGWQGLRTNPARAEDIKCALSPIRKWMDIYVDCRTETGRTYRSNFRQLQRDACPPFADENQFPTIQSFERYVKRSLRNLCGIPRAQIEVFRSKMANVKAGLDKRNRKLLRSAEGQRLMQERSLLPSCATLIIVPDALLEHWYQQITQHLDLSLFLDPNDPFDGDESNRRGVVYLDGIGDIVDARMPLSSVRTDHHVLPSAEMSQYLIVVTTFGTCKSEYRRLVDSGRVVDPASGKSKKGASRKRSRSSAMAAAVTGSVSLLTPLLQQRFLRLVVDEGHELGTHTAGNEVTRFIHEIAAERRFVLSGTPTTGNEDDDRYTANAMDQVQRLLMFLRHPKYGDVPSDSSANAVDDEDSKERKVQAKQQWDVSVKDPFLNKEVAGREELVKVLKETMVMHRKEDIQLPKPVFEQADVDVPIPKDIQRKVCEYRDPELARAFFNEYLHGELYQTLVDQAQAEYIIEQIRAAKKALRDRGGPLTDSLKVISGYKHMDTSVDRRPIKAVVFSSARNILLSVTEHLLRSLSFENIAELYADAKIGDLGAELSRFRNGFKEQRTCPVCRRENDLENKRGSHIVRCQQTLLEVVVDDSIAIPTGQPRRFLIEPERIITALQIPVERMEGEPLTAYGKHTKFWRLGDILEVDIRDPHPVLARRESEDTWIDWGSERCKELASSRNYEGSEWYYGPLPEVERDTLHTCYVRLSKWQKCGKFHSAWYTGPRLIDMPIERVQEDVFILSLERDLATGLDLSFVTHMFLLEAIDDAALLEQLTSRAHRLGATGPVLIDTVNTFWKVPWETEQALEGVSGSLEVTDSTLPTKQQLLQEKRQTLSKVVCQYCYRQFESIAEAEEHERLTCQRNPKSIGVADPFHLSSIYETIRPPPALESDGF